jgi:hypothetical protein
MTRSERRLDLLITVCAVSAGVHAALTPEHLREGTGPGAGFALATALLALAVALLTVRPYSAAAIAGSAILLLGLIVSYAAATTTGLPVVHPEREQIEVVGAATKLIEAAGVVAAALLLRPAATRSVTLVRASELA